MSVSGLLFVTLFVLFASAEARSFGRDSLTVRPVSGKALQPQSDWECSTCVSFMDQGTWQLCYYAHSLAIDNLINIIAQVGIGGGCSAVCGLLPAQWEATICMLACEVVGIEEFANLVNEYPSNFESRSHFRLVPILIRSGSAWKLTSAQLTIMSPEPCNL